MPSEPHRSSREVHLVTAVTAVTGGWCGEYPPTVEIEAQAKHRLADEYDAAQERGEVAGHGGARKFNVPDENVEAPTAADIGLSRKDIHEARIIRDAEKADPGIVRRVERDKAGDRGREGSKCSCDWGRTARVGPFAPNSVEKGKVEAIPYGDEVSERR